ncbi:MAG: hypothetical protein LBU86_04655, partial [Oscillospiraceae bacterium]|nr:hypothetical protein [Oscillospiraceae bacterium]
IERNGLKELYSFTLGQGMNLSTFRAGENRIASIYSDSGASRAFVLGTGEEIAIPGLTGNIDACNADLTRFVVSEIPAEGKGENPARLIDREGNTLAGGYTSLYEQYGTLIGYRYNSRLGIGANYILDWDGNILLGAEYSRLEILPGNAALAIRGDLMGITDFAGNWLYSESVFEMTESSAAAVSS